MREMTASEASRNFSSLLDEAEHGETIVVTRNGRRVALIVPAPRANGRVLRDVFRRWSAHEAFDDTFERNVVASRETASTELDNDPWRD